MPEFLEARKKTLALLRRELVGPERNAPCTPEQPEIAAEKGHPVASPRRATR